MNNNLEQLQEHHQRTATLVDAEMILFADEHSIPLQDAQQTFTCPFSLVENKTNKYKLLSKVALHVLCIPATSAPSERDFQ
jgi:hypothetical protein